jgi:hypothetical protein
MASINRTEKSRPPTSGPAGRNNIPTWLCLLALVVGACGRSGPDDFAGYRQKIGDPDAGLVQSRQIGGMRLTVKYLPPEYLAYQELRSGGDHTEGTRDSLLRIYRGSMSFLLTIAADGDGEHRSSQDVMMHGVANYQEFAERSLAMNFDMARYVTLNIDGRKIRPVLATMDSDYGMSSARNIVLVFSDGIDGKAIERASNLDFIFSDEIFETGISHFPFSGDDIRNRPTFTF